MYLPHHSPFNNAIFMQRQFQMARNLIFHVIKVEAPLHIQNYKMLKDHETAEAISLP